MTIEAEETEQLPENCPLFPEFKRRTMGWIEARRVAGVKGEDVEHATIGKRFSVALDEVAMAEQLGGGRFWLTLKDKRGEYKTRRKFKVEGPAKDFGDADDEPDDDDDEDSHGFGKMLMLARVMKELRGDDRRPREECTRCLGSLQTAQAITAAAEQSRAAATRELEDMRTRHRDDVDRLRKDVVRAEEELAKIRLENAGWLKSNASASDANQIVSAVKELAPGAPAFIKSIREAIKGPVATVAENLPRVTFGGGK